MRRLPAVLLSVILCLGAHPALAQDGGAPESAATAQEGTGYLTYSTPRPAEAVSIWGAMARTTIALAVVLALLGGTLYAMRRMLGGTARVGGTSPVRMLGRVALSPKQAVYFLQLPGRILVVGSGGGQLSALAEITDPAEMAEVAQATSHMGQFAAAAFGGLLQRRLAEAGQGAAAATGPDTAGPDTAGLDGIRRQIANLRTLARPESR